MTESRVNSIMTTFNRMNNEAIRKFQSQQTMNLEKQNDKKIYDEIKDLERKIDRIKKEGQNYQNDIYTSTIMSLKEDIDRFEELKNILNVNIIEEQKAISKIYKEKKDINQNIKYITDKESLKKINARKKILNQDFAQRKAVQKKLKENFLSVKENIQNRKKLINYYEKIITENKGIHQEISEILVSLEKQLAEKNNYLEKRKKDIMLSPNLFEMKFKSILNSNASPEKLQKFFEEYQNYIDKLGENKENNIFNDKSVKQNMNITNKLIEYNREQLKKNMEDIAFLDKEYAKLQDIYDDKKEVYDELTILFRQDIDEVVKQINIATNPEDIRNLNAKKRTIEHDIITGHSELFDINERIQSIFNEKNRLEIDNEYIVEKNKEYEMVIEDYQKLMGNVKKDQTMFDNDIPNFFDKNNKDKYATSDLIENRKSKVKNELYPSKHSIHLNKIPSDDIYIEDNNLFYPKKTKEPEKISVEDKIDDITNKVLDDLENITNKSLKKATDTFGSLEQEFKSIEKNSNSNEQFKNNKPKGKKIKAVYNASETILTKIHVAKQKTSNWLDEKIKYHGISRKKIKEILYEKKKELLASNIPNINLTEVYKFLNNDSFYKFSKPGETKEEAITKLSNELINNDNLMLIKVNSEDIDPMSPISKKTGIDITSGEVYAIISKDCYKSIINNREENYQNELSNLKKGK